MAKAITVKVATPKVIKALETKLVQVEKDYANQATNEAKYEKEVEKWRKVIIDYAVKNVKSATNLRVNPNNYRNNLNVDFDLPLSADLPKMPERDFEVLVEWKYKETVEEISNAIRLLKMTDEETVNASTMKSIAQYL